MVKLYKAKYYKNKNKNGQQISVAPFFVKQTVILYKKQYMNGTL